jgi:hypothetical protein
MLGTIAVNIAKQIELYFDLILLSSLPVIISILIDIGIDHYKLGGV